MSILCMTGWQQPADSLANIAPGATHFDYGDYDNTDEMFGALPKSLRIAIGWSLGGQLLVRAIAAGHVKPERLLLLGAPFQWVADAHFTHGVPQAVAGDVEKNYRTGAKAMLAGFHTLIALGDTHEKQIISTLDATTQVWENGAFWLGELARASCFELDFSGFPPTTIVHGLKDKVITAMSATAFARRIAGSELHIWPLSAHAPHLHDPDILRQMVSAYV
jgi:pimeloyl-ACP methyl ester carboxylesterase